MKLKLQAQHQLFVSGTLALTVLLLTSALLIHARYFTSEILTANNAAMRDKMMQQVEVRGKTIGSMLSSYLVNPVYHYDLEAIRRLLDDTASIDGIQTLLVTGPEGKIIHDGTSNIERFGQHGVEPYIIDFLATGQEFFIEHESNSMLVGYSIRIGGELLGCLILRLTLDRIQHDIVAIEQQLEAISLESFYEQLIIAELISLFLFLPILFFTYRASKYFTLPIKMLASAVSLIDKGNYGERVSVSRQDELGELAEAFNDMSLRLANHENEMSHIAYHDPLTELPNRLMLKKNIEQALNHSADISTYTALMLIDLDDFKQVNDTLGHDAGDILLKRASERITHCLREAEDSVLKIKDKKTFDVKEALCRLGGDEFTVLAKDLQSRDDASLIAKRVIRSLKQPFNIKNQPISIGASIGIALAPVDGDSVDELLKNADLAMYHAKNMGKNNFQYFDSNLADKISFITKTKEDIDIALENEQFQLYFQPQVSIESGSIIGAEALVRWMHPELGFISPATFIPLAEESGQILQLGQWVQDSAAKYLSRWSKMWQKPIHIGVNFSARQLADSNLSPKLSETVKKYGVSPEWLHVEVTETMLIKDASKAIKALNMLDSLGFPIWLDDFGTGFSSLSHLQCFPLKGIKLDQSFVRNLGESQRDRSLAMAIVSLGHTMNLSVIAEGIETDTQRKLLVDWGCKLGQGYYFYKPMSADAFEMLLFPSTVTPISIQGYS